MVTGGVVVSPAAEVEWPENMNNSEIREQVAGVSVRPSAASRRRGVGGCRVTVTGGRSRDRKNDLLVIRDNGNSFKIIPSEERDDFTTVIEKEEWKKTRQDMERHLSKLRDFSVSNWF
ncbi:putative L-arabinose-binding periplasmic protein-like [Capsicum annuum]|nr:putative L-arabinose-binding periplasmic protein-like [Capsicum annuum]